VDGTLCRTLAGQELTLVEGRGGAAARKAPGYWIHTDSMHPLHCLPGNCISCDDYVVAFGLLKEGQNLQQDPLPSAGSILEVLARGGAVKQNPASAEGRAESAAHNASASGPSAADVCTGGSISCLAWERQVVGTCCRLGHHGTLCAHCDDGWVKAKGLCMPCQSFHYLKLIGMIGVYVGLCAFFWRKATRLKKPADVDENAQSSAIAIVTFFFQTVLLLQIDVDFELGLGFLNLEPDSPSPDSTDRDGMCLSNKRFYVNWASKFAVPFLMAAAGMAICTATRVKPYEVRRLLPRTGHHFCVCSFSPAPLLYVQTEVADAAAHHTIRAVSVQPQCTSDLLLPLG
jgi:hypothetical protein